MIARIVRSVTQDVEVSIFPSLKRRAGCGINETVRSHRSAADGVARSASPIGRSINRSLAKASGLNNFAELTTPAAPLWNGSILLMARPPLLFKEGNRFPFQLSHSFYET